MSIRRTILATGAAALLLAGCAGTVDDTTPVDAAAAADEPADSTNEADQAVPDDTDGAATTTEESTDEPAAGNVGAAQDSENADHGDEGHTDDEEVDGRAGEQDMDAHEGEAAAEIAAGDDVDRVVEIDMQDIAFSTDELQFAVGERVKFVFENVGEAPHEALIGDMHLQEEHEAEMAEGGGHHDDGHHGELSMISLEPGESGSLVHEFTEAGDLWMGCHVPGHWGAGMQARITVTS